jgi:hypothetical protein
VYVDSFVAGAYQRDDIIPVVGHRPTDVLVGMGWRFY